MLLNERGYTKDDINLVMSDDTVNISQENEIQN
jgi:hypothetical protein